MAPRSHEGIIDRGSRRGAWLAVATVMLAATSAAGCSVVGSVGGAVHRVANARSVVNTFTASLKNGPMTFEATYVTTGSAPAAIVYAAKPPRDLLFSESQTGGGVTGSVKLISNSSGEYLCTTAAAGSAPGSQWLCQKLGAARARAQLRMLSLYTPAHWVGFLQGLALAAGFAGDKVSTSTMTINGISMSCVDFVATSIPGKSTICTTPQHILGYVNVAGSSSSFELKSYSASPPPALFQLPPGARISKANSG